MPTNAMTLDPYISRCADFATCQIMATVLTRGCTIFAAVEELAQHDAVIAEATSVGYLGRGQTTRSARHNLISANMRRAPARLTAADRAKAEAAKWGISR